MMEVVLEHPTKTSVPLTRIQKLIGRRMIFSKRTKPCFYLESQIDVTDLMAMRPKLRKSLGIRITSNTFFIHALALAAKQFPIVLGAVRGEYVRIADAVNVGFAVNTPQGLVVPVIRNADTRSLSEIAHEEDELVTKARSNKLTLDEIENETIALSNLGVYGTDSFFGIVPPPASTILAIGNVIKTAVPMGAEIVPRKLMSLTVAADIRVVSETYAAEFFGYLRGLLENPQQLTLN
jgi:pyruvate dehydrogenase E2 component (dihydrolipoamide acetyltransferase)